MIVATTVTRNPGFPHPSITAGTVYTNQAGLNKGEELVIPIMVVNWLHCRLLWNPITLRHLHLGTHQATMRTITGLLAKESHRHKSRYAPQDSKAKVAVGKYQVMLPDFPITDEEREQYKAYRQYLRDLPEQAEFPNITIKKFEEYKMV